ncbi:chemotaxis protein [uncultured Enterovirga sp.]|uniref:chemotaxis protein n=1 Tax=uncultured Enterovirga sp. TaxID=2026352 RepID=UPI0035CC552C
MPLTPWAAMPSALKSFRIEHRDTVLGEAQVEASGGAAVGCPPHACRHRVDAERLSAELTAMREAISATKREVSDLQRFPATGGIHRAACELDAVSAATERATTTILGAVEEIEFSANLIKTGGAERRGEPADVILDRVLVLYEACNFQDITGQRIRKVVTALKVVEERVERMIAVWGQAASPSPDVSPLLNRPAALLSGPCLPGEAGHVSQSDVDAYFS